MTTVQYKKRQEHKRLVAEVKNIRVKLVVALNLQAAAERELKDREKFIVKLGLEKGFWDQPEFMLATAIHPREFQIQLLMNPEVQEALKA